MLRFLEEMKLFSCVCRGCGYHVEKIGENKLTETIRCHKKRLSVRNVNVKKKKSCLRNLQINVYNMSLNLASLILRYLIRDRSTLVLFNYLYRFYSFHDFTCNNMPSLCHMANKLIFLFVSIKKNIS